MELSQKVKNRATLQSSNCTTRYLPKGHKNTDSNRHMHPNGYSSIINNSQNMEKKLKYLSPDDWIKKMWFTHTHPHTHTLSQENEILPFAVMWMELESIILSKVSQRKTKTIWFHSYVGFKKQTDEHRGEKEKQMRKQTLKYREQTEGCWRGGGQGVG